MLFQQKEIEIRRQFRDTINIQRQQYKEYKAQILAKTPKEEQRAIIKRLKEDQRRKLAMLGDQYEQSIAEMLQRQSLRLDESQVNTVGVFHEKTNNQPHFMIRNILTLRMTVIDVPVGVRSEVLFLCPSQFFIYVFLCKCDVKSWHPAQFYLPYGAQTCDAELLDCSLSWVLKPKISHRSKASHHRLVVTGTKHELKYGKINSFLLRGFDMV